MYHEGLVLRVFSFYDCGRDFAHAPAAGVALLEYSQTDTSASAAAAAEDEVARLKPLYNEGYGRFRNSELILPKKGHRIRKAMKNP